MAITTVPRPGYVWRCLFIAALCVVLGVWGIYDYVYKIPARQKAYEQFTVVQAVADALETTRDADDAAEKFETAAQRVQDELVSVIEEASEALGQPSHTAEPADRTNYFLVLRMLGKGATITTRESDSAAAMLADAKRLGDSLAARGEGEILWLLGLLDAHVALQQGPRPAGEPLEGVQLLVFDWCQAITNEVGDVTPPSAFDRPVQWMFILCLPIAPFYIAQYLRIRGRRYTLDDDGTLHMPEGTWKPEEIADIDMGRWMEKSVAEVVHADGTRVKLDDYFHRDLHLVIGGIAHRLHPEQWNEDGTKVKSAGSTPAPAPDEAAPDASVAPDEEGSGAGNGEERA
jgi:hypothetical protein